MSAHHWLTMRQGAEYTGKPSPDAFYRWCRRHGVTLCGSSRKWLVDRQDVDAAIMRTRRAA